MGAVTDSRWSASETTCAEIEDARNLLQGVSLSPSAYKLLRHPGVTTSSLSHIIPELASINLVVLTRGQYSAHLSRQGADLQPFMEDESLKLEHDTDYSAVRGLSSEVRERSGKVRPGTIGMEGMTPTTIVCLLSKLFTWIVILTTSFMLATSQYSY